MTRPYVSREHSWYLRKLKKVEAEAGQKTAGGIGKTVNGDRNQGRICQPGQIKKAE
jgi:hypothetical protein